MKIANKAHVARYNACRLTIFVLDNVLNKYRTNTHNEISTNNFIKKKKA